MHIQAHPHTTAPIIDGMSCFVLIGVLLSTSISTSALAAKTQQTIIFDDIGIVFDVGLRENKSGIEICNSTFDFDFFPL